MEEEDEIKFGSSNLLFEDNIEKEDNYSNNLSFDEEFLKPSKLIYEETSEDNNPPETKNIEEKSEIRIIKFQRKEPKEESGTKLLLEDKNKNDSNKEENLFKPKIIEYEEPLETSNKRREGNTNIKPLDLKIEETVKEEKKQSNMNKKELIKPSKHFITTMKDSIEKNSVVNDKDFGNKKNEKNEPEKKYMRYQHNLKKENEKPTIEKIQQNNEKNKNEKAKENIFLYMSKYSKVTKKEKKENQQEKEKDDNVSIYISKYSKVTNKKENKNKEIEKNLNINETIHKRGLYKSETEKKDENHQKMGEKKEPVSKNENTGYHYVNKTFKKEEPEKNKKEEIKNTISIESTKTTSKYGERYSRSRTNIEEPKKIEKEPVKEKEEEKIETKKYTRYRKTVSTKEPENEEKPKEETTKFSRRTFYKNSSNNNNSNNSEIITKDDSKLKEKEKEVEEKQEETTSKRGYYGRYRRLRSQQEEKEEQMEKEVKKPEITNSRGYNRRTFDIKKEEKIEEPKRLYGKYSRKEFRENNNDDKENKIDKEKENDENKPNRYNYRGRYSKNSVNDENNNNEEKNINTVVERKIFRNKINPKEEIITSKTTTTTSTSDLHSNYSRRTFQHKDENVEEPKIDNKNINEGVGMGIRRRFKYLKGK